MFSVWPDALKKRTLRYLLQNYLGNFFLKNLSLEQLSIDLYRGTATITDIPLDVEAINDILQQFHLPFTLTSGTIEKISVSIPWSDLMGKSCTLQVKGLELILSPKNDCSIEKMTDSSLRNSAMAASMQIAQECYIDNEDNQSTSNRKFEGLEAFAKSIESILSRIEVSFEDIIVRFEQSSASNIGIGLEIRIQRLRYSDNQEEDPNIINPEDLYNLNKRTSSNLTSQKFLSLYGVSLYLDEFDDSIGTLSQMPLDDSEFKSCLNDSMSESMNSNRFTIGQSYSRNRKDINFTMLPAKIAAFSGKQEVTLKFDNLQAKQRLEIDCCFSTLNIFATSKHITMLTEAISSLMSPGTSRSYNDKKFQKILNKPMSKEDFHRVELDLEQQLGNKRNRGHDSLIHSNYSSDLDSPTVPHSLDDVESFYSFHGNHPLSELTSPTTPKTSSDLKSDGRNTFTYLSNPSSNTSISDVVSTQNKISVKATFSSLSITVINVQLTSPSSSVDKEKCFDFSDVNVNFFDVINEEFKDGFGRKDFEKVASVYCRACRHDHLRLIMAPLTLYCESSSDSLMLEAKIGATELIEHFFRGSTNERNSYNGKTIGETIQLISSTFSGYTDRFKPDIPSKNANEPFLTLTINKLLTTRSKNSVNDTTKVNIKLASPFYCEFDITLMDRWHELFNLRRNIIKSNNSSLHSNHFRRSNFNSMQGFLRQTLEEPSSSSQDLGITINAAFVIISIRFPIADKRPIYDPRRQHWWQYSVREERLIFKISKIDTDISINSDDHIIYDFIFKDMKGFLLFGDHAELVQLITTDINRNLEEIDRNLTSSRILIHVQNPQRITELERSETDEIQSRNADIEFQLPRSEPSPFSRKQVIYEAEKLIIAGDDAEMTEFQESASSSSRVHIEISLPNIELFLVDHNTLELLYNRLSNDLLLWEPSAPIPAVSSSWVDCTDGLGIASNLLSEPRDKFVMCKSSIKHESSSSSDEDENIPFNSQKSKKRSHASNNHSNIAVTLHFGHCRIGFCSKIQDFIAKQVFIVEDLCMFVVTDYEGIEGLQYICAHTGTVRLYQGVIYDILSTDIGNCNIDDLRLVIHPAGKPDESNKLGGVNMNQTKMLYLAIKISYNEVQHIKDVTLALNLKHAVLKHEIVPEEHNWLTQLQKFFNVADIDVPGYVSATNITMVNVNIFDSGIDYRPRQLQHCSYVDIGTLYLSTNVVANAASSLLRIILQNASLHISGNMVFDTIDLCSDYAKVIEVKVFDVIIRLQEDIDKKVPKVDITAARNSIIVTTCADSLQILMNIVQYIVSDGDLSDEIVENVEDKDSQLQNNRHADPAVNIEDLIFDAINESTEEQSNGASVNISKGKEMEMRKVATGFHSKATVDTFKHLENSKENVNISTDEEFEVIDLPCSNRKESAPLIEKLTREDIVLKENYFAITSSRLDTLAAPSHFPIPVARYTLSGLDLVWRLHSGNDFPIQEKNDEKHETDAEVPLTENNSKDSLSSDCQAQKLCLKRDNNSYMEFFFDKIRLNYEEYPEESEQLSRIVFVIREMEIRDNLSVSKFKKFMYMYSSEDMPRQTYADMLTLKLLFLRPESLKSMKECCIKVSVLPLRFNIDQDALIFFREFFTAVRDLSLATNLDRDNINDRDESSIPNVPDPTMINSREATHSTDSTDNEKPPLYIKSFVFAPDMLIRIDYQGKRIDTQQGLITGIILGLAQFNSSELKFKSLSCKSGLLGFDKLLEYVTAEWLNHLKSQFPNLLGSVGPMTTIVQLIHGFVDLLWLPVQQYRKDGRILRGVQRGATSFTTSSSTALLEFTGRVVSALQHAAEFTYSIVTPEIPDGRRRMQHRLVAIRKPNNAPANVREGLSRAMQVVTEGFNETATTMMYVASREREHKGVSGAVGGILKQLPSAMVQPFILATQATNQVIDGVKNQLVPDALHEATEKWKGDEGNEQLP